MTTTQEDQRVWASHSSLITHRQCPEKWMFRHVRKLEKYDPEDPGVEKDMGSWWQLMRAADSLERAKTHGSLQQDWDAEALEIPEGLPARTHLPFDFATPDEVQRLAEAWWERQPQVVKEAWDARLGQGLPERLRYVYDRWQAAWYKEIANERPLAIELRWERELRWDDFAVMMVGHIDEAYLDTKRNIVVIRDNKAPKTLEPATVADDMMDSQLQLYAWGAAPLVHSWGLGKIQATAYDRARMKKPTTPVVTQMGSLSKSVTDFDLHTYVAWVATEPTFPGRKADGSQAGTYRLDEKVVEKLSTPAAQAVWHQRTLTPLNPNLIRIHLRTALDSAKDAAKSYERAQETHEAARNLTRACRWCDFVQICRAEMIGGADGDFDLEDFRLRTRRERR